MAEYRKSPDLLRAMVKTFAEALMGAEADAMCGAPYGQPSEERVNYRNGYRDRRWDTRAGTIELAIPGLRGRQLFPGLAAGAPPPLRAGAFELAILTEHIRHGQTPAGRR
jgi:transposase-like protein